MKGKINRTVCRYFSVFLMLSGIVSFAAPKVSITPADISPNGDGNNDAASIQYTIPGEVPLTVTLTIIDNSGKYIKTLFSGKKKPGKYVAYWNGKGVDDKVVPVGKYKLKMDLGIKPVIDKSFAINGILTGLLEPKDVTLDKEENIYILDKGEGWIYKFSPDGKKKEEIMEVKDASSIRSVQVDDVGGLWYSNGSHGIKGPAGEIGGFERDTKGAPTSKSTYWAGAFALGPDNKIYIRNASGRGFRVFDRTKTGLDGFLYGTPDKNYLFIATNGPCITTDMKGDIWGTGHTSQVRKIFDDGKKIIYKYAIGKRGSKLGQFNKPTGLCFDGESSVYVADTGNNRIQKIYDDGKAMSAVWQFGSKGNNPANGQFGAPVDVELKGDKMFLLTSGENASLIKYKLLPVDSTTADLTVK